MHEPLSQRLAAILEGNAEPGPLTANRLMDLTEGRGGYLFMILLSLPFVAWVSPPGLSTILGTIITILGARMAMERPPHLPARYGDRPLPPRMMSLIRGSGLKFLRFLERGVRPRRTSWMSWRAVHTGNALLVAFMAFLLALPLPSPPFYGTNALPSYAIMLLAASMMEEDGLLIWVGYAMSLGTCIYFALWADVIVRHLPKWLHALRVLLEAGQ